MEMNFIKAGALCPLVTVGNPIKNGESALSAIIDAHAKGAQVVALPELFISGYTCADLFGQDTLISECENEINKLAQNTGNLSCIIIIGFPFRLKGRLLNCAAVIYKGEILGIIPKCYLPNYQEFYEKRWFVSGLDFSEKQVFFGGKSVPFGKLLFQLNREVILGVEICEDLWMPVPPSSIMALNGANLIVNISASNEIVTKDTYRRSLVSQQSARCICGYILASAGVGESTTDLVFSGACIITENGTVLADGKRFEQNGSSVYACVDMDRLNSERRKNISFHDNSIAYHEDYEIINAPVPPLLGSDIDREFDQYPFVPRDIRSKDERCREILEIQVSGLAKRLTHTKLNKAVIGISGGLDSTLALLVTVQTMKYLGLPRENIICVTMPGFGTTDQTYTNALELIHSLGAQMHEIDIKPACIQHMKDIGHDSSVHDITYENTQARERTQILMDIANKEGAILVGTGDLSELAMGWCTYNGDHMSMYGVNASIPKTLVRHLVASVAGTLDDRTSAVLNRVLETPVSPELLPPDENGNIAQKTEETIGPYELHDFFLYHFIRFGASPKKLKFMANRAFAKKYTSGEIDKWLKLFIKRFFISQFKRSCMPDGPKVGSVSLSPRGDWRMPSDADMEIWLKETEGSFM